MERRVIKIDPVPVVNTVSGSSFQKRRVAAYARVSTSSDEQLLSVEAQKDYYPHYIATYPNWEFVALYADEGISGTSSKNRSEFNRMIEDALNDKIDLIITKSISRFARNTVDTLTAIRKLKEFGVEVFFEKEQIFTFDSKGEFMLTLLSSMAQEESRSISENVKWGLRKRMADGKYSLPYRQFLGYKKGLDGKPEIVEEEAAIIRRIYRMYLEGRTPSNIAAILTDENIPTPAGCSRWMNKTVISILTNEKYYGAALLQKTFIEDFLTKKWRKNNGELAQYFIQDDHDPIISKAVFDEVQVRILCQNRVLDNPSHNTFANKLICGDCGGKFGRKIVGSYKNNKKYRHIAWKCNDRYNHSDKCMVPHLYEEVIVHAFNEAIISKLKDDPELIELCRHLTVSSIRSNIPYLLKRERDQLVSDFLADFLIKSPKELFFDDSEWRVMINHAVITRDRKMTMYFIDGSNYVYTIPKFSPIQKKNALK
ncbi:recombinase family protein [Paradesulfitobacterium aromaticivorans]